VVDLWVAFDHLVALDLCCKVEARHLRWLRSGFGLHHSLEVSCGMAHTQKLGDNKQLYMRLRSDQLSYVLSNLLTEFKVIIFASNLDERYQQRNKGHHFVSFVAL